MVLERRKTTWMPKEPGPPPPSVLCSLLGAGAGGVQAPELDSTKWTFSPRILNLEHVRTGWDGWRSHFSLLCRWCAEQPVPAVGPGMLQFCHLVLRWLVALCYQSSLFSLWLKYSLRLSGQIILVTNSPSFKINTTHFCGLKPRSLKGTVCR